MTRDAFDFQIIFEIQTQHNYVVSMHFQMKPDCNLIKFNNENILFCFFLGVESFKLTSWNTNIFYLLNSKFNKLNHLNDQGF